MRSYLVAAAFLSLVVANASGQTLTPRIDHLLFDSKNKLVGAPFYRGNVPYVRFGSDVGDLFVPLHDNSGFSFHPKPEDILFSEAGCTGDPLILEPPAYSYGQPASLVGCPSGTATCLHPSILYLISYDPAFHTVRSRREGIGCVDESTPLEGIFYPLTLYVDIEAVYARPYFLGGPTAPATPTFIDVPTSHPFYQFVELLAASAITGGCGGGKYCPDSPLTRGQMAVFLAQALGLRFRP